MKVIKITSTRWGNYVFVQDSGYTIISLSNNSDVVKEINREIMESGGDGIVSVEVSSQDGITNSIPLLNLLPIWPTYSKITVEGDIVKFIK